MPDAPSTPPTSDRPPRAKRQRRHWIVTVLVLAATGFQPQASAQGGPRLSLNAGAFAILDNSDERAWRYGMEFLGRPFSRWQLTPAVGFSIAEDDSHYIYADLKRHFLLNQRWILTPSLGAGFFQEGKKLDLGHPIEFKSALEIAYQFDNQVRIGVAIYHLSNSRLSSTNPGTETVMATLSLPLFD